MIITVDIGNTNIKIALFQGKRIIRDLRMNTQKNTRGRQYYRLLKKLFSHKRIPAENIEAIVICSVVPSVTGAMAIALRSLFKKRPFILGKDLIAPIKNCYKKPRQVGQDRLANAVGAYDQYGAPLIVVDFGTALTFDLVSRQGHYLGGVIVPGLEVSLNALIENAALLSPITLKRPKSLIGKETSASILSGIVYGLSFLVEGMIAQLKNKISGRTIVVATGGKATFMAQYCPSFNKISPQLTHHGLRISYEKALKRKKS
ncbi:MAG: type III pantothenate kinase [Candidatus Omnitrophota bacterium]